MNNGVNVQLDGVDIKRSEYYHCQQLIQQSGGGEQQQAAPEGEPVYRAGGKLVKRV